MELIKWKLDKTTDAWNNYFWNYKSLQKRINFNAEAKTNYYGEILSYFNDTFDLIQIGAKEDFYENIFHYTGLLQIIYVHQDLIDETLYIFKLPKSPLVDKNPNRSLRNELVGHPIRRSTIGRGELLSSVIFSNNTNSTHLEYLIYSRENDFKMKIKSFNTQDIINSHKAFLNKYFDLILKKIIDLLLHREKRLGEFEASLDTNIKFEKIIKQTEGVFEFLLKFNYLYKRDILLECFSRKDSHLRYKFAVDLFLQELKSHLKDSRKNILEFVEEIKTGPKKHKKITLEKPLFEDYVHIKIKPSRKKVKMDYDYALGKLHGKGPVFGIDYFRTLFPKNKKILAELENMEMNYYNDLEYYSSYEYLRKLILKKEYTI